MPSLVFNSLTFIAFFVIVIALHSLPLAWRVKKFNLLIASYLFYAAWNPPFVILIWISTLIDWTVASRIPEARSVTRRRLLLAASLVTNLGLLGFFKYGNFLLENFIGVMDTFGIAFNPPPMNIILPVGISFYTFQTLSYTFDVYRGELRPSKSFLDFALFVTFFPQLVAGPIMRAVDFLPQCDVQKPFNFRQMGWGLALVTIGLFEKIVLADAILAPTSDAVFNAAAQTGFTSAWIGTIAFSGQIFFDFAGYSTCAIGAAMCLGFALSDNFHFPYAAIGFTDFWRRWHISLSTWLRDYLYISLGGNRKGRWRTRINLVLTMLLGGLWHGASWRFVVWGGLHGMYLIAERIGRHVFRHATWTMRKPARFAFAILTYLCVCIAWVFFRASDFSVARTMLRSMAGMAEDSLKLTTFQIGTTGAVMVGLLLGQAVMRNTSIESVCTRIPSWLQALLLAIMIVAICLAQGEDRAFIYFQF